MARLDGARRRLCGQAFGQQVSQTPNCVVILDEELMRLGNMAITPRSRDTAFSPAMVSFLQPGSVSA